MAHLMGSILANTNHMVLSRNSKSTNETSLSGHNNTEHDKNLTELALLVIWQKDNGSDSLLIQHASAVSLLSCPLNGNAGSVPSKCVCASLGAHPYVGAYLWARANLNSVVMYVPIHQVHANTHPLFCT